MELNSLIEAALFVSGKNMSPKELAKVFNLEDYKQVKKGLDELVVEYSKKKSGIEVYKTGGSYGMRVRPEIEEQVLHLIPETDMPKAMLKTLALIAYEQPVKQAHVVKIRGNRNYEYLKRLEELDFIHRQPEGHTKILTTTPKFNKYFKINDAKELVRADIKKKSEQAMKDAGEDVKQTTLEVEEGESVKYENMK